MLQALYQDWWLSIRYASSTPAAKEMLASIKAELIKRGLKPKKYWEN